MPTNPDQHSEDQHVTGPAFWLRDRRHRKMGGIAAVVVACLLLLLFSLLGHEQVRAVDVYTDRADLDISKRVIVPALKPLAEDVALDDEQLVPKGHADATLAQDTEMREIRMKSAIIAQDLTVDSASVQEGAIPETSGKSGARDANSQFAQSVSGQGVQNSVAHAISSIEYKVLQGKMIEAVLESRATSDLPGMVCATVQRDVYGAQQRTKLIPWGSRVCGQYSAELRTGQERLFVVWNTLRRPDGVEVTLDSLGADQLGTAGMGGLVDTHFARIFGVSSLLSIIGLGSGSMHATPHGSGHQGVYYRDAVQMAAANTAQQILQPYLNMQPTIVVPAGARIRIYVNRDLDFSHLYQRQEQAGDTQDMMVYE